MIRNTETGEKRTIEDGPNAYTAQIVEYQETPGGRFLSVVLEGRKVAIPFASPTSGEDQFVTDETGAELVHMDDPGLFKNAPVFRSADEGITEAEWAKVAAEPEPASQPLNQNIFREADE